MLNSQTRLIKSTPTLAKLRESLSQENPQPQDQEKKAKYLEKCSSTVEQFVTQERNSNRTSALTHNNDKSDVILIVDDTPDNLMVLFSYLENKGFKVLLAEDGQSALQIAQTQSPDLILLDVLMPEIDGFETCRQLKAKQVTRDIPVIFLTALSETVNKVRGFNLGGVDYITKPSEQEEVLARVQTHLNLHKMQQSLALQNQELEQALDFEALVRRITDKLRDSLDESQILQTATEELTQVLELSSCQIEFYDWEQNTTTIAYENSYILPLSQGSSKSIEDFPELYQQLLQKIPVQLVEKIPQFNPQDIQVTRLACPIFDDRGIIGNLWSLRPPNEVFTTFEIQLMQQVASQCAIAIRQARLYESSNKQVEELAKLTQLKDDFLKTISHELNAPISSIQLAAQTMENLLAANQNPQNSPIFQRVLQIFHESCQRQKQLIDDLLTLCYVDAKAHKVQTELIDLNLWLTALTQPYLRRTQDQQQQLILDFSAEELHLRTDPLILERMVQELLHNACKYTLKGEKIIIQTQAHELEIFICVINTGIEIPVEEQKLIFNQFYRIPNKDPWKYGGTGLGLTLVQKLAQILNATIDVKSENNQTVFRIRFSQKLLSD